MKNDYVQELGKWELWFFPSLLGVILIALAQYDFVTFHTLAEFFAIVISLIMFAFAWTTDGFTKNRFLIFLACGYFAVGMLDMVHAFVYQGVNFFVEGNSNLASQFWIVTRYFEALLLLLSPSFIDRRINKVVLLMGAIAIAIVAFATVMSGNFPDTFIDGVGLTPFKVTSEYVINLILIGAIYRIMRLGDRINPTTRVLIVVAAILTMAAELAFTFYVDVFGLSNQAGHILKIFSFWMIFRAIVLTNLQQPYLELHEAHNALQRSESKHRTVIDNTSQGYWMVDGENTTIDVNEALCKMLGYKRDEIIGASPYKFVNAKNLEVFIRQHVNKVTQKDRRYDIELTSKDGLQIPTLFAATTMQAVTGEKPYSFALITDISEHKRIEAELLEHREHLEDLVEERTAEVVAKASQLEVALGREKEFSALQKKFVSLVSHEFRTPLTIIDAAAQRLLRHKGVMTLTELKDRSEKIRNAVKRMVSLIDSTLYVARFDAGTIEMQPELCDLREIITDVCANQSEISPNHKINIEIDDLVSKITGDRNLLDLIFSNLLSNAVKFSPDLQNIEVWGGHRERVCTHFRPGLRRRHPRDGTAQDVHAFLPRQYGGEL